MVTKISRGTQFFIFDEKSLTELLETKNVLCNEELDGNTSFAFTVYSRYQDMKEADDFICVTQVSDGTERFIREGIRVLVPKGTAFLEIFPYSYAEIKEVYDAELDEFYISLLLPDDREIPLENILNTQE